MSGATWKEHLNDIFKDINSPDQINLDQLVLNLRGKGINGLENIEASLARLESGAAKQEVITLLWALAQIDEKGPEEQRDIYARLARHYDKLFEWEDVSAPGWIIIPGPFFP